MKSKIIPSVGQNVSGYEHAKNNFKTVSKKTVFLLALSIIATVTFAQTKKVKNEKHLDELVSIMQGTYSSEKQAKADTSYYSISLRMIPYGKKEAITSMLSRRFPKSRTSRIA